MAARLREQPQQPPEILVHAIHGAWSYFSAFTTGGFSPLANLVPETLYRASHFTKYLEAYSSAPAPTPRRAQPAPSARRREEDPELAALTPEQIAENRGRMAAMIEKFSARRMP